MRASLMCIHSCHNLFIFVTGVSIFRLVHEQRAEFCLSFFVMYRIRIFSGFCSAQMVSHSRKKFGLCISCVAMQNADLAAKPPPEFPLASVFALVCPLFFSASRWGFIFRVLWGFPDGLLLTCVRKEGQEQKETKLFQKDIFEVRFSV